MVVVVAFFCTPKSAYDDDFFQSFYFTKIYKKREGIATNNENAWCDELMMMQRWWSFLFVGCQFSIRDGRNGFASVVVGWLFSCRNEFLGHLP